MAFTKLLSYSSWQLAAASMVLAIATIIITKKIRRGRFCQVNKCYTWGPAYPHTPLLLGIDLLWEVAHDIIRYRFAKGVRDRFSKYGVTHQSQIFTTQIVNTIDPLNLETVMKTRFDDYTIIPGRRDLMRVLFGLGVFGTAGADWYHSRSLVRSSMKMVYLDPEIYEKHTHTMIATIRGQYQEASKNVVDFSKAAFDWSINVTSELMFGFKDDVLKESGMSPNEFTTDFTFLEKMARVLTIFISQIPFLSEILFGRPFKQAQRRVYDFVDSCSRLALSSAVTRPSFDGKRSLLEGLATQTSDLDRIRSECLNLLLAGHDTVGIALSELFYCLARNPRVWSRLREEVALLKGRQPTIADLKSLTYLQYVIKEAIRVRPTLSVHGRLAIRDTVLPHGGGPEGDDPLFVGKGTYILYSNYTLYRNPAVFGDDVDEFRPERWADAKPARYEYLNFGAGPRHCPGKEMGWTMLAYATARLALDIEFLSPPPDDKPWEEARAFSFHNRHGVHINMTPAKSATTIS